MRTILLATLVAVVALAGCSGGSGSASDDPTPTPTPTATPEATPTPSAAPTPADPAASDDEICIEGLAPTDAPPPPEVTEPTEIATIDTDVWDGELPRDEDLVVAGATLVGIVDGVAARVDLSTGEATEVDVGAIDGAATVVGAAFTAPGSWWLALADDATGTHVLVEIDATTGCELSRFDSEAALEPVLVDGANLWAAEIASGDLHLLSYPEGEPLDVFEEDVSNWEITTTLGGDLAQIGFCGEVSAVPGNGIDPPYEGRLGDGDEQCGDRWGSDGDVMVMADDSGDADDPAVGWWFDMSGVTIGRFALPFDVEHVDPDALGAWVLAGDGSSWRLPAPSTRAVGIVQGCLEAPPPAEVPFGPPGVVLDLGEVDDPSLIAARQTLFGLFVTLDGPELGWVDPTDGSSGSWEVGVPLTGVDVVAPDSLWMVTRADEISQLLGVSRGCIDDVVTTDVAATGVVTVTPENVWVRTADDIVAVDRTTGLVVDDLAAALSRSTLSADEVSALPADLAAGGVVVGLTDAEGSGFLLTGECGVSVAVQVTGENAAVFDPGRCDLGGFVPSESGAIVGWGPDGSGGSVIVVIGLDADGVTGTDELTVPGEIVTAVVGEDLVHLVASDGSVSAVSLVGS